MIHLFLFIASYNGQIEVVKELLNRGANIEEKDNYGNTPLIEGIFIQLFNHFKWFIYFLCLASSFSRIEFFKRLSRKANVEEKNNNGSYRGLFLELFNHF